jgi:hypothetical protein
MRNKVTAISALAAGIVLAAGGSASASDNNTTVKGGDGFSGSPVVVNAPQQGLVISNGEFIDARCVAPWSNGAVLGIIIAPDSKYAACNTGEVDQSRGVHVGGLLI